MNSQQARALITETFSQPFDKDRYRNFAINLLHHLDESKAQVWNTTYIKDAFKGHVKGYKRLGTYTSPDNEKLDVLVVHLTASSKLERARTAIRNFVAHHLKSRDNKDAALVAFVSPMESQWRLSYVKMEYSTVAKDDGKVGVRTTLTPARRSSYIVGQGESCHTAQTRFLDLLQETEQQPTLAQIESAFSVEAVTKEFFEQYKALFLDLKDELDSVAKKEKAVGAEFAAKNISTADFAKKLMGQIVFLYFLQKKGWLGVARGGEWGNGPHNFLRQMFDGEFRVYKNFFNDVLEPLFYDTLATDRGHDAWCKTFNSRIPFLNGGLFEPLRDYDWRNTDIVVPNAMFSNTKATKAGDVGTGILDVFDRYNFTVNEAEPLEKEVAIDPEMLGKVFENLLEVKERKSKGSYYTPREIVHYMCQESLISYLDTAVNTAEDIFAPSEQAQTRLFDEPEGQQTVLLTTVRREIVPRGAIEIFIRSGDQASHYEAARVEGTGYARQLPKTIETHGRLLDEQLAQIAVCDPAIGSGAFPVGMMQEIVRARSALTPYFDDVRDRTAYHFKRHAIQNCLYGVDLDPGAVEIAKLRLWLSLVVDEDDVQQIKPLPNLDYKIVAGNSLLGVEKTLFNADSFRRLEELKPRYFDASDRKEKEKFKSQIDGLIHELTSGKASFDFEIYFSEVFHAKKGFDVVIGNPPYVRVQNLSYDIIDLYKKRWSTAWKRIDVSTLFMELAMRICRRDGTAVFISSNQFLATEYGRKTREFFLRNAGFSKMLDMADLPVFESTLTYVSVFVLQPSPTHELAYSKVAKLPFVPAELSWEMLSTKNLGSDVWVLGANAEASLVKKLISGNPRLDTLAKSGAGVITGLDEVLLFEEDDERIRGLEKDLLMPVLRAQSCKRYGLAEAATFALYPYDEIDGQTVLIPESELKRKYPRAYGYLRKHRDRLAARKDSRTTLGEKGCWYGLVRFGRRSVFTREKIVSPGEVRHNKFALDKSGSAFSCARVFAITSESTALPLLHLLGLLNSKLVEFYLHKTAPLKQGGYFSYNASVLDAIPIRIPVPSAPPQNTVEQLVKRVLSAREKDVEADTSALERKIDELVYALYGLTKEEEALVEAAVK